MKKSIILATVFVLMLFMTSCGNSSSSDEIYSGSENSEIIDDTPHSYTLSEYLNSGKTLILYRGGSVENSELILKKNSRVDYIVILKDSLISIYDSDSSDLEITFGEISKMTDDEVIAFCEQSCIEIETNIEYQLKVYTDNSGNFTDYEKIDFESIRYGYMYINYIPINRLDVNTPSPIYDSLFLNLSSDHFWYRCDNYTLSLDTPYSDNVIVDP